MSEMIAGITNKILQDNNPEEGCANRGLEAARLQREYLKQYFMDTGALTCVLFEPQTGNDCS